MCTVSSVLVEDWLEGSRKQNFRLFMFCDALGNVRESLSGPAQRGWPAIRSQADSLQRSRQHLGSLQQIEQACGKFASKTRAYTRVLAIIIGMGTSEQEEALNEARLMSQIHHPHIIQYEESFMDLGETTFLPPPSVSLLMSLIVDLRQHSTEQ